MWEESKVREEEEKQQEKSVNVIHKCNTCTLTSGR